MCNCLHIAISFYQNQQSRKSYKVLVFNLRGHFTPKCRSPPFYSQKAKTESIKRRNTGWIKIKENISFMSKEKLYLSVKKYIKPTER